MKRRKERYGGRGAAGDGVEEPDTIGANHLGNQSNNKRFESCETGIWVFFFFGVREGFGE